MGRPVVSTLMPMLGPVGASISLSGYGFLGATAVSFGGVEAKFSISGDAAITADVPEGVEAGEVVVTTPEGVSANGPIFTVR